MSAEWRHDINFQSTLVPNLPNFFSEDGGQDAMIQHIVTPQYDHNHIDFSLQITSVRCQANRRRE